MDYLFLKKSSLNLNDSLLPEELISKNFMEQYESFIKHLIDDNISQIMRTLYCYDNSDEIVEYNDYIEKLQNKKVKEWIKSFDFKTQS